MSKVKTCGYHKCGRKFTVQGWGHHNMFGTKRSFCSETCRYYAMMHRRAMRDVEQKGTSKSKYLDPPKP